MTVSAPVRFMPTPPERVDRMKMKIFGLLLKRCISTCHMQQHLTRLFS